MQKFFLKTYLFACKGDSLREIFRKIVFLAALIALIFAAVSFICVQFNAAADYSENEKLREIYSASGVKVEISEQTQNAAENKTPEIQIPEISERFLPLLEINSDIVGWLTVGEDKFIDYPVVKGRDNEFYLSHNFKKEKSVSGALAADFRCEISADKRSANIVIYGHNMGSGAYFGLLPRYFNYDITRDKNDLSFYKRNPTLTFSTLFNSSEYKIFGGALVKVNSGDEFQYHKVHDFKNKAQFDEFCTEILDRSTFINPDVDLKYGDNLLTLSTCILSRAYGNCEKRWVIFAREVREGESAEVDVSKAYANQSPLFYDEYYAVRGGEWQGRGWKEDIIVGYNRKD